MPRNRRKIQEMLVKIPEDDEERVEYKNIQLDDLMALPWTPEPFVLDMPTNVALELSCIKPVTYFQTEHIFQIFIVEVHSPSKFWFIHANDSDKLRSFMEKMHAFYRELHVYREDTYKMPAKAAIEGRLCVALYDFVWHRAVIVRSPHGSDNNVTVMYIDYGTIATIPLDDVQFLMQDFANFPYVLMRGRLALVAPHDEVDSHAWNRKDTESFLNLVFSLKLHAFLYAHEKDENIYHLVLNEQVAQYARHSSSINEKLALLTDCRIFTSKDEVWPCRNELYPTFDMLEKHQFPTYQQLMRTKNVESYWDEEKTAAFYTEEQKLFKRRHRSVFENIFDAPFEDTQRVLANRKRLPDVMKTLKISNGPARKPVNPFKNEQIMRWLRDQSSLSDNVESDTGSSVSQELSDRKKGSTGALITKH